MIQIAKTNHARLLFLFYFLLISGRAIIFASDPVVIEFSENARTGQVLNHVLKITNITQQPFKGIIAIDIPVGIRSLSRDDRAINLAPGDSVFVSSKLLLTKDLTAGEKIIRYNLLNETNDRVAGYETSLQIEQRERLTLLADNIPTLLTNPDDSVRINVTLLNGGNITEQVYLVFNVPNLQNAPPFTEMTATLSPGEQRVFLHSFLASSNLLATERFQVRVTVMKGKEKKIVDTRTINVQSIITRRSYNSFLRDQIYSSGEESLNNAVQLSYRTYNRLSQTVQLQGGTYIDVPAGFLHLKGNVYRYNSQPVPYVTNTSLTYQLNENQFVIGNVQEQAELSLYGRGVKAHFSDMEGRRQITFGAIDQNYNLFDKRPLFEDYFSYFIKGELKGDGERSNIGAVYVYQKNPYEKATFHMGSLQWQYRFNPNWNMEWEAHATTGYYGDAGKNRYSGAAEMSYNGRPFKNLRLSGSAYYSDPYFPGNRKGVVYVLQNGSVQIAHNMNLNLSYSYNRSEPKSYSYDYNYRSQNRYGNISLSLPAYNNINASFSYQHQMESSPSYSYLAGEDYGGGDLKMISHRIGWQWRWQNSQWKHSFFGTIEGGFFRNPLNQEVVPQGKTSLSFSYRWLTAGVSWQQGAYYLFEQVMAQQQGKTFNRFTASSSVNHRFSQKFDLSAGINFSSDVYQGNIPSVNLNARYSPGSKFSFILTGNWYKYPNQGDREMVNAEIGVRYRFLRGLPLKGKKSSLIAKVYYDHNANNRFDEGDEPAEGYMMAIDREAFITGKEGDVKYTSVPFGNYVVKPMQTGEWSFDQQVININRYKLQLEIPLRHSGTLQGNILYIAGENSIEIDRRSEGFRFTINRSDGKLKQTVVTDGQGNFITFLPTGEYSIVLDQKTLPEHTECKETVETFTISGGKVTKLKPFKIEIKSRRVNVRKFFAQSKEQ